MAAAPRAACSTLDALVEPQMVFLPTTWGGAQGFFSDVEGKLDTEHSPVWNYKTLAAGNTKLQDPAAGKISLPVWNDELYFEYHRGVFTTQSNHKRNMREAEEQVLNAEKFRRSHGWTAPPIPANDLRKRGKRCSSINSTISRPGSGIGVIYQDAQRDYDVVRWTSPTRASQRVSQNSRARSRRTRPAGGCRSWFGILWRGSGPIWWK